MSLESERLRRLTREGRRAVGGRDRGGEGGRGLKRDEGGRSGWKAGKGIGGLPRGVGGTARIVAVAAEEGGREGRKGLVGRETREAGVLRPEMLARGRLRDDRDVCCNAESGRDTEHRDEGGRRSWLVGGGKME